MPSFRYRVRDRQGKAVDGITEGASLEAVSQVLGKQGYIPITISELKADAGGLSLAWFTERVTLTERNIFARQLLTLQRAGVPLLTSLASLRDQVKNPAFRKVIAQIIKDLEAGDAFSTALSRYPRVFDLMFVHMVKAGEASGKLDEVLLHLAELGEFEGETKERLKSATRYPLITFVTLMVAFCLVITLVLPKFANLYAQFTAELPLPTRILLGIEHVLRHQWLEVIFGLGALYFLSQYVVGTRWGRYQWDNLKLKFPVFGQLYLNLLMSRFTRVLAELLASGIPILQALQLVSDTVGNEVIRRSLVRIQASVNEGKGMAEPMKQSGLFSPMVYQMISVGEQSGKTDELLRYVADYYRAQAGYMMKNLTTLIEPMLIFVIGGFVLVLALGVFLPLWDLMSVMKR